MICDMASKSLLACLLAAPYVELLNKMAMQKQYNLLNMTAELENQY